MKFKYQKIRAQESEAFPERRFILRPIIPIILMVGDKKHILPLKKFRGIKILTSTEFLAVYEKRRFHKNQ